MHLNFATEKMLKEFMKTFEVSTDYHLWIDLLKEEQEEFAVALHEEGPEEQLKELVDVLYVMQGLLIIYEGLYAVMPDTLGAELDEFLDEGVAHGMVEICETLGNHVVAIAFKRVHESNMSKLGEDGKPIRRADGKVLKGPNYKAPDLSDLVA